MSDKILNVSDDSFEQDVLKSSLPVLVDFWLSGAAPASRLPRSWTNWPPNMRAAWSLQR